MKIEEAIKQWKQSKKKPGKKTELKGIKIGNVLLTNEMLESTDFGVSYDIIDPAFQSACFTMKNKLDGNDKPHLIAVKGGKK